MLRIDMDINFMNCKCALDVKSEADVEKNDAVSAQREIRFSCSVQSIDNILQGRMSSPCFRKKFLTCVIRENSRRDESGRDEEQETHPGSHGDACCIHGNDVQSIRGNTRCKR